MAPHPFHRIVQLLTAANPFMPATPYRRTTRLRRRPLAFPLAASIQLLEPRVVLSANPYDIDVTFQPEQPLTLDPYQIYFSLNEDTVPVSIQGDVSGQVTQAASLINLDDFRTSYGLAGINAAGYAVAVLDTGIQANHPAFAGRVVAQYDFVNDDNIAEDVQGHGSHVAGIIGSSASAYLGVAQGVNIIALKVLGDNGSGSFGDVEDALQWVIDNQATYNIVAVNMSLGSGNYQTNPYTFLEDELSSLKTSGVAVVSAAGNSFYSYGSTQGIGYPAISPNSWSVGAVWDANVGQFNWQSGAIDYTTAPDRITSFTQRGTGLIDIFAPGALITSAAPGSNTATLAGTSQAAPHIAGVVAIMQDLADTYLGRRLSVNEMLSIMQSTGATINDGDDENDNVTNTGASFKRVDVQAMALAIQNMAPEITVENQEGTLTDGSSTINFNGPLGQTISKTFTVTNNGGSPLILQPITISNSDFSITNGQFTADQSLAIGASATFTVTLNTTTAGSKAANLSFANNDPDEGPFNFSLTGTVTGSPEIALSVDSSPLTDGISLVNYGNISLNQTTSKTFTVTNTGDGNLILQPVVLNNSEFIIVSQTITPNQILAAGQSATFTIRPNSVSVGNKASTLSLTSTDADESLFTVDLTSVVIAPPEIGIVVDGQTVIPGSTIIDFGNISINQINSKQLTISNVGNETLAITNVDLVDGSLTIPAANGSSILDILGGESYSFSVTPTSTLGRLNFYMVIQSNDSDESIFVVQFKANIVPQYDTENNNYYGNSVQLGTLGGNDVQRFIDGRVNDSSDIRDYYRFSLSQDGMLTFQIDPELDPINFSLYIDHGGTFTKVGSGSSNGTQEFLANINLSAGNYFLQLYSPSTPVIQQYLVTLTLQSTSQGDLEPNNYQPLASHLGTLGLEVDSVTVNGTVGAVDIRDMYKFNVVAEGIFVFETSSSSDGIGFGVYQNVSGSLVKVGSVTANTSGLAQINLTFGEYYLNLYSLSGTASYTQTISMQSQELGDVEPNNSVPSAIGSFDVSQNIFDLSVTGSVNPTTDTRDRLSFNLFYDGIVNFQIQSIAGSGAFTIYRKQSGSLVRISSGYIADSQLIDLSYTLPTGEYQIHLHANTAMDYQIDLGLSLLT